MPYVFNVRGSQELEIGFLKLFFATEYVDFSNIKQSSPLEVAVRSMTQFQHKQTFGWDAIIVPFIVRRQLSSDDIGADNA